MHSVQLTTPNGSRGPSEASTETMPAAAEEMSTAAALETELSPMVVARPSLSLVVARRVGSLSDLEKNNKPIRF